MGLTAKSRKGLPVPGSSYFLPFQAQQKTLFRPRRRMDRMNFITALTENPWMTQPTDTRTRMFNIKGTCSTGFGISVPSPPERLMEIDVIAVIPE